jgi:hypothetical protein
MLFGALGFRDGCELALHPGEPLVGEFQHRTAITAASRRILIVFREGFRCRTGLGVMSKHD